MRRTNPGRLSNGGRMAILRLLHVAFPFIIPRAMRRMGVRGRAWYYDLPTVILAVVPMVQNCRRDTLQWAGWKSSTGGALMGLSAGFTFHAMSVTVIKGKVPQYVKRAPDPWLLPTAVAEELIWRDSWGEIENIAPIVNSILFGVLHIPLGGWRGCAHMTLFGLLAEACAHKRGLAAAIGFHVGYNLAQTFGGRSDRQ